MDSQNHRQGLEERKSNRVWW